MFDDGTDQEFRHRVDEALRHAKKLLDPTRQPECFGAVLHIYDDQFLVAELITQAAIAGQLNILDIIGLPRHLDRLRQHALFRSVRLRFTADVCCKLDREEERILDGNDRKVDAVHSMRDRFQAWSMRSRTSTRIIERFWRISVHWQVSACECSDAMELVLLQSGYGVREVKTCCLPDESSSLPPRPEVSVAPTLEVDITWLLRRLSGCGKFSGFNINRLSSTCCTPRRNDDIDGALKQFSDVAVWAQTLQAWLQTELLCTQEFHQVPPVVIHRVNTQFDFIDVDGVRNRLAMEDRKLTWYQSDSQNSWLKWACGPFSYDRDTCLLQGTLASSTMLRRKVSVVIRNSDQERLAWAVHGGFAVLDAHAGVAFPLVLKMFSFEQGPDGTTTLSPNNLDLVVAQHRAEMTASFARISELYAGAEDELSGAFLYLGMGFLGQLCDNHRVAIEAIEAFLRTQLIAAVGKVLIPEDFVDYMDWHNRRVFRKGCRPHAFAYPIQLPGMSPDAHLSVELKQGRALQTFVAQMSCVKPMSVPLSASVNLLLRGERFLHAVILHRFGEHSPNLTLSTRVRMFGCVVLVVGTITAANTFTPKTALILRSGEAVAIPLLLETLPTAQEFRDATESLSLEQQRFASSFRAMQLASTVFAVCVIPVKPQLERLLNLPVGSLTQELQLTQDILQLLIDYQIPSSLMGYNGDPNATSRVKVEEVRRDVRCLYDMIDEAKAHEVMEQKRIAALKQERLELERRLQEEERRQREIALACSSQGRYNWSERSYSVGEVGGPEKHHDYLFKLLLVGGERVGKSSLLHRFTDDVHSDDYNATIGVEFKMRTVGMNGKVIKLQIWDTAGQARFQSITSSYYRGALGIMLVFDVADKESFFNLNEKLVDIGKYASEDVIVLLVGNKCDDIRRVVDSATAEAFAQRLGIPYIETSAKMAQGVDHAFLVLAAEILSNQSSKVAGYSEGAMKCACASNAGSKKAFMSAPSFSLGLGARLGSALGAVGLQDKGSRSVPAASVASKQVQSPASPPIPTQAEMSPPLGDALPTPQQPQLPMNSPHEPQQQEQDLRQHEKPDQRHQCYQQMEMTSYQENGRPISRVGSSRDMVDFDCTRMPALLDRRCDDVGDGRELRPTIIRTAERWTKWSRNGLMDSLSKSIVKGDQQRLAHNKALDLLDALSQSGALQVEHSSLHVMFALTHCFDNSVLETLVRSNINPIDKVEESSLIIASAIHEEPLQNLVVPDL